MNFKALILAHNWLSVQITLLQLYPDQAGITDSYERVFEELQFMEAEPNAMEIVLKEYDTDGDDVEANSTYIDVSGRNLQPETNEDNWCSYAIEFERWEKWLGMEVAPETLTNFTELEIIAHCLYEMTFCGYEQDEIQAQIDTVKDNIEVYKNLSPNEKKEQTISWEDLNKKIADRGES